MNNEKVLGIDDAARELKVSRNLIWREVSSGRLPGWIRLGDRWLISRVQWELYLQAKLPPVAPVSK